VRGSGVVVFFHRVSFLKATSTDKWMLRHCDRKWVLVVPGSCDSPLRHSATCRIKQKIQLSVHHMFPLQANT
jgi:hypothetical protein